jgi:hypothetical protein
VNSFLDNYVGTHRAFLRCMPQARQLADID